MSLAQFIERIIIEEEYQYQSVIQHENDPTLPLRGRQNKKIADRNRKIKSLLDNYTSKPPEDRNPLIFLKAAQRFLLKHDYSETAQVEENNNDDQDQEN
ncbi:hypothetical protein DdX_16607 [Ditylenchus destructor]|uniref:Uncharacterized protein n=1 Tax=Ditylenchus destructor TaxID=166010 RepID=A0AAD4MN65_9BILA|nr:hypothetical protein DdX_16607 [Ditylenchus destructor]